MAQKTGGFARQRWGAFVAAALFGLVAATTANAGDATPIIDREIECLALTIYFKARGESDAGKKAVGHVVMNRTDSPRYPRQICNVVRQGGEWPKNRCQFSWWCDGRSGTPKDITAWKDSMTVARYVFWGCPATPPPPRSTIMPIMWSPIGASCLALARRLANTSSTPMATPPRSSRPSSSSIKNHRGRPKLKVEYDDR